MNRNLVFILIVLFVFIHTVPLPAQDVIDGGVVIKRFALIVANNYGGTGMKPLKYTGNDAKSISQLITQIGGVKVENTHLLLNPNITGFEAGFNHLEQLIRNSVTGKGRIEVIFYFSGHSDNENLLLYEKKYSYKKLQEKIESLPVDVRIVI